VGAKAPILYMKAIVDFKYMVDGNSCTNISVGDEIPTVAEAYALKNDYAEKALKTPLNKAKQAPLNKGKAK
jgi:hypothetical protein